MATIMWLPNEILEMILGYSDITIEDIINFRSVCKRFREVAKTKKYCFHEKKFFQRWPSAKKFYDKQSKSNERQKSKEDKQKERLDFIKTGIDCVRQLQNMFLDNLKLNHSDAIFRMESFLKKDLNEPICVNVDGVLYYNSEIMSLYFKEFYKARTNNIKIIFFMDEIKQWLIQPPRVGCKLKERYYYTKLFDYLMINRRESILKAFEEQSDTELFEESATILAQQLQPGKNVFYSDVKASLNAIALEALNFLKEKHPEHSIFSKHDEDFSYWQNNNIKYNYWDVAEGTQIMNTLEEYMFGKLNFRPVDSKELEYMCIDYVLENKYGHELIVYIIYKSVARRLGLDCFVIIITNTIQFLFPRIGVFWNLVNQYMTIKEYDTLRYENSMRFFYINSDKFPNCIIRYCTWNCHFPRQTFAELVKMILRVEVQSEIHYRTDKGIKAVYDMLRHHVPKTRPQEIKFAVGMIVTHGDQSTDCNTGVIIGWNQFVHTSDYDTPTFRQNFYVIRDIAKHVKPLKMCSNFNNNVLLEKETYYIILTKNDKLCCVKEDDITLTEPNWIENRDIYRYFSKFKNTHYVPNKMLRKVYPRDAAITAETISKNYSGSSITCRPRGCRSGKFLVKAKYQMLPLLDFCTAGSVGYGDYGEPRRRRRVRRRRRALRENGLWAARYREANYRGSTVIV